MKFNKVRSLLIICNILFILMGYGLFSFLTPALNKLALADARQALTNKSDFIIDTINKDDPRYISHNYGLSVYVIPRDSERKPRLDMYTFYIVDDSGEIVYTSNDAYNKVDNFKKFKYIIRGFSNRDTEGETIGLLGNKIYYTTTRIYARNRMYVIVYDIDVSKINHDVYMLEFLFMLAYYVGVLFSITLSVYIDKQYLAILNQQNNIFDTYKLLNNTGLPPTNYLRRIKKVLNAFSFSTSILFAINNSGQTLFRNHAALDMQIKLFGRELKPGELENRSNWFTLRESWVEHVNYMIDSQSTYSEWDNQTLTFDNKPFYSKNRIKRILVENEVVFLGEIQNITEISLAKIKVEYYSEYLETIYNTVHDVILITNFAGIILDSNNSLNRLLGYELKDIINTSIERIILNDCITIDEFHYLCSCVKADGSVLRCEIFQNKLILPNEDKKQIMIIQDVTEREALKEKVYASIALATETIKTIAGTI